MSNLHHRLATAVVVFAIATSTQADEPAARPVTRKTEHFAVELRSDPCPGIGFDQAAAVDSRSKRILLWGGLDAQDNPLRNLAAFELSARKLATVEVKGKAPNGICLPAMAVDPKRHAAYIFGGWPRAADNPSRELHRLLLEGKDRSWELLARGTPWPSARNGACLVADPEQDCFLLLGGDGGPGSLGFTPLGDLWRFDLSSGKWNAVKATGPSPPARWHAMAAIEPTSRKLYLFGGAGLGKDQFDRRLYELDLKTSVWRVVRAGGDTPPSLQGATLTFDLNSRALVLVGGLRHERPGSATSSEIWLFDLDRSAWEHVDGGEAAQRRDHTAAYDPGSKAHYVLGGQVSKTVGNFYERGESVESVLTLKLRRKE